MKGLETNHRKKKSFVNADEVQSKKVNVINSTWYHKIIFIFINCAANQVAFEMPKQGDTFLNNMES